MANDDLSDIAGLPSELGIDEELAKESTQLDIRVEERRYSKPMTVVSGFSDDAVDLDELASTLKSNLATGGTVKNDAIELQGDHRDRARDLLTDEGYHVRG